MTISIRRVESGYTAQVTPPHGERPWSTDRALTAKELVDALRALGCHTTDIGDAFYAANPDWLSEVS